MRRFGLTTLLLLGSLLMAACATLPKATVDTAMLLERQITILEQSHLALVDGIFAEKRAEALDLLDNELYPAILNNYFSYPQVEVDWKEAFENPNKVERVADLQELVSIIHAQYMEERNLLLLPIEEARNEAITTVREEYAKAKQMSGAILENVASVQEIQQMRRDNLSKVVDVDALEETVYGYLEKANEVLDKAKKGIEKVEKVAPKVESVIEKLK